MKRARDLWCAIWSSVEGHTVGRLNVLFSPSVTVSTGVSSGQGRDYAIDLFRRHSSMYSNLCHEICSMVESVNGEAAAIEARFSGTLISDVLLPDGSAIEHRGREICWTAIDMVHCDRDGVVRWHAVFDRMAMLEQLRS